jgi:hypothetical protein
MPRVAEHLGNISTPKILREDFCGTAIVCAESVSRSVERKAIGVDLDLDVLEYGRSRFRDVSTCA